MPVVMSQPLLSAATVTGKACERVSARKSFKDPAAKIRKFLPGLGGLCPG